MTEILQFNVFVFIKGQLISKCTFGVFKSTKEPRISGLASKIWIWIWKWDFFMVDFYKLHWKIKMVLAILCQDNQIFLSESAHLSATKLVSYWTRLHHMVFSQGSFTNYVDKKKWVVLEMSPACSHTTKGTPSSMSTRDRVGGHQQVKFSQRSERTTPLIKSSK